MGGSFITQSQNLMGWSAVAEQEPKHLGCMCWMFMWGSRGELGGGTGGQSGLVASGGYHLHSVTDRGAPKGPALLGPLWEFSDLWQI